MASGNFGRGGRGAALLQALAEMSSRPGQMERENQSSKSTPHTDKSSLVGKLMQSDLRPSEPIGRGFTSSEACPPSGRGFTLSEQCLPAGQGFTSSEPSLPMGRGSLLAHLRQSNLESKQTQQQQSQKGAETLMQTVQPSHNGSSNIRVSQSQEPGLKPMGRGLAAMQHLIAQQKSAFTGRGFGLLPQQHQERPQSEQPLVSEMTQLKVNETPKIREKVRLPTVTKIGTEGDPKLKMRLLNEHKERFKTVNSFDGSVLYLPFQLPDKETTVTSTRKTDGAIITITVTFVKLVPPEQCCHLYNVVFRRIMYILEMCQVGHYYYNPKVAATVPQHRLEVWPGYITAIHEHEDGLLLLLDASHRVLRTETVYTIMSKAVETNPKGFREEISRKVVGCIVLTRYNNKTYRVDDILWDKAPVDRFECKATGESMSFEEYYRKQHNIVIENKSQPLLLNKRKPPKGAPPGFKLDPEYLCLIPELCYMTGLTDDIRQNFTVMKDLAVHTRVTPAQRQFAMNKFIHSVNSSAEARAELAVWGIELDSSTISIAGRLLPQETIIMGNRTFPSGPQADWSREVSRHELISPVSLLNWGIFYTRRDAAKANDFVIHLQSETRNLGIVCQAPFRRELANEKIDTLVQELRNSINERVQLVVVINPTNRDDRYSAIKKVCCVESPVPSQVIIAKTISRADRMRSVVQKIALQINCKLGGELWAVKIPLQKLMVVGIDTYHDSVRGKQSIAGFVASMNVNCTRWYSNVCFQLPGQELVLGLQICLTNALKNYHSVNHFLPEKIVIFRDGVGDGQLDVLANHEVKQLQRCFTSFGQYTPQCTTVCVQKRINTKIYRKERNGEVGNPPPGTVVDHTITRRDRYDFFLVSQHVRQGTVSPTHYIVVEDGLCLQPGLMQRLTYKMTHLYYNWPGTVRVPAPCQYAHKLAYLVGESIHKEPAECLSDRLFFL